MSNVEIRRIMGTDTDVIENIAKAVNTEKSVRAPWKDKAEWGKRRYAGLKTRRSFRWTERALVFVKLIGWSV